ncbi:MAG: lysophospholipid acyltransferase family protein, partial [Gemmatimonas sp.]
MVSASQAGHLPRPRNVIVTKLDRGWRRFATGLSFFLFGTVGLFLGGVFFPALSLFVRQQERRAHYARRTIAWTFRLFVGIMRGLRLLDYDLQGFERLNRKGLVVIANHPSLIDTVFLLGFVHNSIAVADDELFRNSFTGAPLRAAGFIRNDAGAGVLDDCVAALDAGMNVVIFPEGTRTPRHGAVKLKRGVANIAIRAERNLTPIIIQCSPRTLMKGEKWWQIPER